MEQTVVTKIGRGALLLSAISLIFSQLFGHFMLKEEDPILKLMSVENHVYGFVNLVGFISLVLSIPYLYSNKFGKLGFWRICSYILTMIGTILVLGDVWFETFVTPMVAKYGPEAVGKFDSMFISGALLTFGAFTLGWLSTGIRIFKEQKLVGLSLMLSSLYGCLPLVTPRLVPFAITIGIIAVYFPMKTK